MAISLSEEADSATSGTTGAVTLTPVGGELIVVCWVIRNGAAFTSVTDSQAQTWTEVSTPVLNGARAGIHYLENAAAGSTVITVTSVSDTILVNGSRWAGAATSSALVASDSTTNNSVTTHPHGATGVSVAAGQLIITCAGQGSTVTDETVATDYTALGLTAGNNRQWWQYRIASGSLSNEVGAYTAGSHNSAGMIGVFAAAAAGGASRVHLLTGKLGFPLRGKI